MTRRKSKYPSTFYEWVVGTTIESALGPIPKKKKKPPRRRGVLRVEISTDDESGEDSVRITYPRTQPSEDLPRKEVKKVRFQEQVPRKSALKKQVQVVPPEPEPEEAVSDSATDGSSSEVTDSAQSAESSGASSEGSSEVETTSEENETTDSDSGPQSSGEFKDRGRNRRKLRRSSRSKSRRHRRASDSSGSRSRHESESETNSPAEAKSTKCKKRASKKAEVMPESDTETSESLPESSSEESEPEPEVKKKRTKKEKVKKRSSSKKAAKSRKSSDESEQEEERRSERKKKADKDDASKTPKQNGKERASKGNYPEANPVPHPRRPNYVAPVRAEVVQTERVIETPDDPPPNAFYDAEHNIIRVYQGPVYGGNPSRSLYPKRDSTQRPLPAGTPHPTQNPYYHGFNAMPPKTQETGNFNVPITQGAPVNAWHATYPPPDFAYPNFNQGLGNLGAFNNRGAYHDSPELGAHKNAVPKASGGHNVGPASDSNKARQGKNVGFAKGPQLTRHQREKHRTSVFADWGKRASPSGSLQGSKEGEPSSRGSLGRRSWYHGNTVGETQIDGSQKESADGWNTGAQNDDDNYNNAQDGNGTWDAPGNDGADGAADQANDGWGEATPADGGGGWGTTTAEESWNENNNNDSNNNTTYSNEDNNVAPEGSPMPGTYPAWGDASAAANTNGQVDEPVWDDNPQDEAEPVKGW